MSLPKYALIPRPNGARTGAGAPHGAHANNVESIPQARGKRSSRPQFQCSASLRAVAETLRARRATMVTYDTRQARFEPVWQQEFLEELKAYMGFTEVHARTLRELGPSVAPGFSAIVERFYSAIRESPRAMAV